MFFTIGTKAMLILGVFLFVPLFVQLFCGTVIILKIRKVFRRDLDVGGRQVEGSIELRQKIESNPIYRDKKKQKQEREFRAAMTVSIMIGVFFLSVFPAMIQNVKKS